MEGVVGACCAEVGFEGGVGGVPHNPELFQLGRALAVHGPGSVGAALIGQPPPQRERPRRLHMLVRDVQIPLTLPVPEGGLQAPAPVVTFGVDDLVGDPLCDQRRVPGGREPECDLSVS